MSGMTERVARKIAEVDPCAAGHPNLGVWARAAIEAIREPTKAMVDGALDADLDIYWSYRADGRAGGPADVWRAMIDAALKEPA